MSTSFAPGLQPLFPCSSERTLPSLLLFCHPWEAQSCSAVPLQLWKGSSVWTQAWLYSDLELQSKRNKIGKRISNIKGGQMSGKQSIKSNRWEEKIQDSIFAFRVITWESWVFVPSTLLSLKTTVWENKIQIQCAVDIQEKIGIQTDWRVGNCLTPNSCRLLVNTS